MKFLIVTHVVHIQHENEFLAYAPYVREMNIWFKFVDEVLIVAPLQKGERTAIDIPYQHNKIDFRQVPNFNFIDIRNSFISIIKLPIVLWNLFLAMKNADHIHLRCPGNMGLLGCFVQILFPRKSKTAKYAGNWDPKSKQPFSYKMQKWILNNTFLTRNMTVLVYGKWENQSKNIKSFFTATYSESEKTTIKEKDFNGTLNFVFVGSLVSGKNSVYALKIIHHLINKGNKIILSLYGEGPDRVYLEDYIKENDLGRFVILNGNQNQDTIKKAYQNSHFVILPSKSEGWPKAIAEGMFWGSIPIASKVSCVPFILDYGQRGILLEMDLVKDVNQINEMLKEEQNLHKKRELAIEWSQNYTTDLFESELKKLLLE
ncbi:glycosyltransferase [Flavobacterium sp. N502536]|uniref:glycosyltransferase n=1 Tax=Flavobacterium sp. N502536 TaxID=2986837 RepID=UPI00222178DD|nr:glycosyltransferase [Flavobacterium sp. N502536]